MTTLGVHTTVARERSRAYWAVADCWNVTRRSLTHYQRQPLAIVWQLGFPIISVLLYGYIFGSAMKVPGAATTGRSSCQACSPPP